MEGLSQDLNNLLGFVQISSTDEVDDDTIGSDDALAKFLGLTLAVHNLDLLVGGGHGVGVLADHSAGELVALLVCSEALMVVTHLLEKSVADQAVHSRDEDSLAIRFVDDRIHLRNLGGLHGRRLSCAIGGGSSGINRGLTTSGRTSLTLRRALHLVFNAVTKILKLIENGT